MFIFYTVATHFIVSNYDTRNSHYTLLWRVTYKNRPLGVTRKDLFSYAPSALIMTFRPIRRRTKSQGFRLEPFHIPATVNLKRGVYTPARYRGSGPRVGLVQGPRGLGLDRRLPSRHLGAPVFGSRIREHVSVSSATTRACTFHVTTRRRNLRPIRFVRTQ